jgi:hypothetical protein
MENNTQSQNEQLEDGAQPTIPNDNETPTNDTASQVNAQNEKNRIQNEKNRLKHKTNFEKWLNKTDGEIENSDQNQEQEQQYEEQQEDEDEDREQEPGGETTERVLEKKANGPTSKIMDSKRAQKIIDILKGRLPCPSPNFKYYIKKNKFNVQEINDQEVLHRTFSTKDLPNQNLPIALKEDFFDILYQIHSVQRGHCGVNKTDHQLKIRYYGIPRQVINQFIKLCPICNLKMTQITQPRLKPIRSEQQLLNLPQHRLNLPQQLLNLPQHLNLLQQQRLVALQTIQVKKYVRR